MTTPAPHGATTEVGRLRTVMLHRPGPELKRLTPRNNDALLFDGIPWIGRAQDEHDAFAQALRDHGVEVLYLSELLAEALEVEAAREESISAVLADPRLGESLHRAVSAYLHGLDPGDLALRLTAGRGRRRIAASGRSGGISGALRDVASSSDPTTPETREPARIPILAASCSAGSANASAAMKSDIVKPMPHSMLTP